MSNRHTKSFLLIETFCRHHKYINNCVQLYSVMLSYRLWQIVFVVKRARVEWKRVTAMMTTSLSSIEIDHKGLWKYHSRQRTAMQCNKPTIQLDAMQHNTAHFTRLHGTTLKYSTYYTTLKYATLCTLNKSFYGTGVWYIWILHVKLECVL